MTPAFFLETYGVFGFMLGIIGFFLIAGKKESGWKVRLTGSAVVLSFNIIKISPANIFGSTALGMIAIYGWYTWRRDRPRLALQVAKAKAFDDAVAAGIVPPILVSSSLVPSTPTKDRS